MIDNEKLRSEQLGLEKLRVYGLLSFRAVYSGFSGNSLLASQNSGHIESQESFRLRSKRYQRGSGPVCKSTLANKRSNHRSEPCGRIVSR